MTKASKTSVPFRGDRHLRVLTCGALAALIGLSIGCDSKSEPVTPPPAPPTAEERFERLVSALEEKLNDSSFGTADAVAGYGAPAGTPVTDAKVEVKHTLTPPEGDKGVHHAQLCLITKAKITVTLPSRSDEDDDAKESNSRRKNDDDEPLGEGLPSREALTVPSHEDATNRLGGSGVHEIDSGVTQRCFELEFRDGAWVLVSEVDEDKEPFNALAIEYALKKQ